MTVRFWCQRHGEVTSRVPDEAVCPFCTGTGATGVRRAEVAAIAALLLLIAICVGFGIFLGSFL